VPSPTKGGLGVSPKPRRDVSGPRAQDHEDALSQMVASRGGITLTLDLTLPLT